MKKSILIKAAAILEESREDARTARKQAAPEKTGKKPLLLWYKPLEWGLPGVHAGDRAHPP